MLAIKCSADAERYQAVTNALAEKAIVECPKCSEAFGLYSRSPELIGPATQMLVEYLRRNCPKHVECFIADESVRSKW